MYLRGKADTNISTGITTFHATEAIGPGDDRRPVEERHELRLEPGDDQGHYIATDTHGSEWELIDYEDEAELHPLF